MEQRMNLDLIEPNGYQAMLGLETYIRNSGLRAQHRELIKLRASQINGCAFCLHMHSLEAVELGETAQRIFILDGWRETNFFSEEEKVILAMTEEITFIHQKGRSSETYQKALQYFDEHYIGQIIFTIVTINAWNRIAISTHMQITQ
ncbi:MAG: carboxymuconolactone decarboxylase family protein [Chitinophagaceae bacterium]